MRRFLSAVLLAAVLAWLAAGPAAAQSPQLRYGPPEDAGLNRIPIAAALARAASLTLDQPGTHHPLYSGEVTMLIRHGIVVADQAAGSAVRYADKNGDLLPSDQQIPVRTDTIFDLASVSKLFTSVVAMQLVEKGRLDLDAPVARYLPEFAVPGKDSITITQLLTHTSGLPEAFTTPLWRYPTMAERIAAIRNAAPVSAPGTRFRYADLNLMVLQQVMQNLTGKSLDKLVRDGITAPLGMVDTQYNPPEQLRPRIAAEEFEVGPDEPDRGMVWGQVHDESAWALGGVAGSSGIFGTVHDLAILAQAILNGGEYGGTRILSAASVHAMMTDHSDPRARHPHGLGFEINEPDYMGWLASPQTVGHTGFTGTSVVIDPRSDSIVIQFSNRVHPNRDWGTSNNKARRLVADGLSAAMALR